MNYYTVKEIPSLFPGRPSIWYVYKTPTQPVVELVTGRAYIYIDMEMEKVAQTDSYETAFKIAELLAKSEIQEDVLEKAAQQLGLYTVKLEGCDCVKDTM